MKTTKWSDTENAALVAAYLRMLGLHNAGTKFNKAAIRRELIGTQSAPGPLYNRSEGSIEFKLMNVSGCMRALGRLELKGYVAAMNYQRELMTAVCAALGITNGTAKPTAPGASAAA
jgi:hypothetical protein